MTLKVAGSKPVIHHRFLSFKMHEMAVQLLCLFGKMCLLFTVQLLAYNVDFPSGNVNFLESK